MNIRNPLTSRWCAPVGLPCLRIRSNQTFLWKLSTNCKDPNLGGEGAFVVLVVPTFVATLKKNRLATIVDMIQHQGFETHCLSKTITIHSLFLEVRFRHFVSLWLGDDWKIYNVPLKQVFARHFWQPFFGLATFFDTEVNQISTFLLQGKKSKYTRKMTILGWFEEHTNFFA